MNPMIKRDEGAFPESGQEEMENESMEESMTDDMGGEVEPETPMIDGEQLQMLLFSRFKELTPVEMQILDSIITPQTVPVLFKLFPELGVLFDMGSQLQGMAPQGQPQPMMGQPQQTAAMPSNPNVSRGLMGY